MIDEFPTLSEAENADAYQLVCWHHYLRPTMINAELDTVKVIVRRYYELPENVRSRLVVRARREFGI
jgi:hypothetical protein